MNFYTIQDVYSCKGEIRIFMCNKYKIILSFLLTVFFISWFSCGDNIPVNDDNNNNFTIDTVATVTDADGNLYHGIKIGDQVWTVENLRTTRYNDDSLIPHAFESADWSDLKSPAYCFFNNTTDTLKQVKWGALYNFYAVHTGKLAPPGWHVPSKEEWRQLDEYLVLNGYNWDGSIDTTGFNKIGKAMAAKTDWFNSTTKGAVGCDSESNNSSGFSALPVGYRSRKGSFDGKNAFAAFWSATGLELDYLSEYFFLNSNADYLYGTREYSYYGFSVRLVQD